MRRRAFRLDSILRLRESEVASAKSALAGQLRAQQCAAQELARGIERVAAGSQFLSTELQTGLRAGAVQATSLAIDVARANVELAKSALRACDEPVASARRALAEARRGARALEILRARFHARDRVIEARRCQRDLDEIGSRIASRGQRR